MRSFTTPFAYLPPDILFIIAGFMDLDIQNNPDLKRPFLNLTGVCRHWRSAFLSCPSFWTRIQIPERSVWHLEEILIRSAEYPLKVTVHYSPKYSTSTIAQHSNIILTHLHRIQSLVIHRGRYDTIPDSILSLINNPVPMLEMFRYDCRRTRISSLGRITAAKGSIPENLFTNHAPKLKEFHVSHVKLCHNLPIFNTITRLSLKNVHGLTDYRLLDILETTSLNLEFLEISSPANFIWPSDASNPNNRPDILLSSLRTLVLKVGIGVLLLILSHTDIPRDIDWRIDFAKLMADISFDLTPFVSFLEKVRKGPYVSFTVYEEYLYVKFKQTRSGPYNTALELDIEVDPDDTQLRRLKSIFASLELSNVLSCELVCTTGFSPRMKTYDQMFQSLFFLLDRMETLSISCDDSHQLDAFVHRLWPRNAQDTISILCPSLNDLKVGLVSGTIVGSLVQRLAARREAGHVLERLYVEYEDHLESHKQDLEKLAQHVIMIR